jgi:hypothetical protein
MEMRGFGDASKKFQTRCQEFILEMFAEHGGYMKDIGIRQIQQ